LRVELLAADREVSEDRMKGWQQDAATLAVLAQHDLREVETVKRLALVGWFTAHRTTPARNASCA
jgi:hypothetical protein